MNHLLTNIAYYPPLNDGQRKPTNLTATAAVETSAGPFPADRKITLFVGAEAVRVGMRPATGLVSTVNAGDSVLLGPWSRVDFLVLASNPFLYVEGLSGATNPYSVDVYNTHL